MLLFNPSEYDNNATIRYFNTSNVTIQLQCLIAFFFSFYISIHLMLLFNLNEVKKMCSRHFDFNTSNVTIQRASPVDDDLTTFISIHLMLLFNYVCVQRGSRQALFQYI